MRYQRTNKRRAVILMVVLSLLTLFALVGVTFVLYADAEATAARVAREAQTFQTAEVNPQEALSFFLSQFIYDVPDTATGASSGLRGHSLARTMYGYFYLSGTATTGSPVIAMANTTGLNAGAQVTVLSNLNGAVWPSVITAVLPTGITLATPWPYVTGAATINVDLNVIPYNGIGRLHYGSQTLYPPTPLTNVPANWGTQLDDYAMVNYTWFSGDLSNITGQPFIRDPERFGTRLNSTLAQTNSYTGANAPYTYPDLNNFFLAAMKADGTVLTPSYHRPWLFQVVNGKFYAFNDMTNPNWTNLPGKYLTLRPRPWEHPNFPLPGDGTGDVKNLPWAPGGNDSIWIDLGAPVMTAPDGTQYKMMFAPLIVDLDGRVNLNTAGNMLAAINAMIAATGNPNGPDPAAWQLAAGAHVSNQGWGPWEVNLAKVLWGDQTGYVRTTPPTPPEWMRLFTGMSYVVPTSALPIVQPGWFSPTPLTPGLSAWLLPGVHGRYVDTPAGATPLYTPSTPGALWLNGLGLNGTYSHAYAQTDSNGLNDTNLGFNGVVPAPSSRPLLPGTLPNSPTYAFPLFQYGYNNGGLMPIPPSIAGTMENTNHPLWYNSLQNPLNTLIGTRAFRASDMEALLRPNASGTGRPVDANASALDSDLLRLCPANFGPLATTGPSLRYRNLVTTQSWDVGAPGAIPYWWLGMDAKTVAGVPTNLTVDTTTNNYLTAPYGAQPQQTVAGLTSYGFPPLPPNTPAPVGNLPGTNPITSEFGLDWRALSANSFEYYPTTFNPTAPTYNPLGVVAPGYVSPGSRIRLNRPLAPYPHMGALVTPPYNSQLAGATPSPYGFAYDLTNPGVNNQYLAAQNARQALANDVYRRLVAITGLAPIPQSPPGPNPPYGTSANPNSQQLASRRWLAQLAVNIVDYIDEDDVMTPFNFYTIQDNYNQPLQPLPPPPTVTLASEPQTQGGDETTNNANNYPYGTSGTNATGANPDFWVFGTELPKVVLNEVLAEAQNIDPAISFNNDTVKVWVELYNTMPAFTPPSGTNPNTTQPQDVYSVPLYMQGSNSTAGKQGYSPYRISISQYTMDQANPPSSVVTPTQVPDNSANVLGKAYINTTVPLPQNTTDVDFSAANPYTNLSNGVPLSQNLNPATTTPAYQTTLPSHLGLGKSAGVDPQSFFLVGPTPDSTLYPNDPLVSPGLPNNIPWVQTKSMTYGPRNWPANPTTPDERSTGLTVMLRRLANPYLPLQTNPTLPNYNPYVTVDYIRSVYLLPGASIGNIYSYGKTQPYAGLNLNPKPPAQPNPNSPLQQQAFNSITPPYAPPGAVITGYPNQKNGNNPSLVNTFGYLNWPLPPSKHFDWLVHLDRPPISPMELLHVSAWPPYKLTQQFMQGTDATAVTGTTLNTFVHYAPWLDGLPVGMTYSTMNCPWWFDQPPNLPVGASHRLYRLFEYLECGDRAFGVNGLGRIPGKVNINTVWDAEILQALVDANLSINIATNPSNLPLNLPADVVSQIFSNMMLSRSPSYYNQGVYNNPVSSIGPVNMGTGVDDRPFMPLSTGLYLPKGATGGLQFPNGFSVGTDTILRTNNPFGYKSTGTGNMLAYPPPQTATTPAASWLLFQNYTDTQTTHPYYQTQLLTKLYNNVTTRSNTFAVFLTVGYFKVDGTVTAHPNIPKLGEEIGASEGKQIRHRMFAIVDRTNLATFLTTSTTPVTGPTPNATNATLNFLGNQTISLPILGAPLTITGGTNAAGQQYLSVPNLLTGMSGLITQGTQLVVDAGNINEETITVNSVIPPTAITGAMINANFTLPHGAGFTIIQRGNPGPQILTPYDPRLDLGVVLYLSVID